MSNFKFINNGCNGLYLSVAIRKTFPAVDAIRTGIEVLLEKGWSIVEKGIWVSIVDEERLFEDLGDALRTLAEAKRGALEITLTEAKTADKVFIRWYNSAPQTDVLAVEGSLSFEKGVVYDVTPLEITSKIAQVLFKQLDAGKDQVETKALSPEYLEAQAIPILTELQLNLTRRHTLAERTKRKSG